MGGISGLISLLCMVAVSAINIGDVGPSLEGTQWLKGTAPVFKNQVTVVEFWRPSCGNCKAQIPHLTSLQKKYGNRISIVALSKEPLDTIEEFIKTNGDQMGFTIGKITREIGDPYMTGISGVPYAYLFNRDGVVVWKGHPSGIDEILERAVEGNIDINHLKNIAQLEASLEEALKTNDPDTIAPINQRLLAADPANEQALDVGMRIARYNSEPAMVREMFDKVRLTGLGGYKASAFAKMLVTESDLEYRYPETAFRFSVYALEQEPGNDSYMDTYARVLYCLGDIEKAIAWEKKALSMNPKASSYQSNLDYYMNIRAIREKSDYNSLTRLQDSKAEK
jgi:thiol-disulfide isomerase/thioredoxin